jgi:hypothetical protein
MVFGVITYYTNGFGRLIYVYKWFLVESPAYTNLFDRLTYVYKLFLVGSPTIQMDLVDSSVYTSGFW